MDYNYKFFKTDKKDSFNKSIIQSISKNYALEEDVLEMKEDIFSFFKKKDINYDQSKVYDHIINKKYDLIFLTIPRESKNIYDLYFKFNEKDKDIFPLFSKKIKKELDQNSLFFSSFGYKYLDFYMEERIPKENNKLTSVSLDFIQNPKYKYDIVNDILSLNIILLDQNLNYYTTYENDDNNEFVVLKKDIQDNFTNMKRNYIC